MLVRENKHSEAKGTGTGTFCHCHFSILSCFFQSLKNREDFKSNLHIYLSRLLVEVDLSRGL